MPAAYAGTCYPEAAEALAQACNSYPQSGSSESGSWVVSCTGTGYGVLNLQRTTDAAPTPVAYTLAVTFPDCNGEAIGSARITPEQAGVAWTWGFVMVLSCYLVAWGSGRVLDAIWHR